MNLREIYELEKRNEIFIEKLRNSVGNVDQINDCINDKTGLARYLKSIGMDERIYTNPSMLEVIKEKLAVILSQKEVEITDSHIKYTYEHYLFDDFEQVEKGAIFGLDADGSFSFSSNTKISVADDGNITYSERTSASTETYLVNPEGVVIKYTYVGNGPYVGEYTEITRENASNGTPIIVKKEIADYNNSEDVTTLLDDGNPMKLSGVTDDKFAKAVTMNFRKYISIYPELKDWFAKRFPITVQYMNEAELQSVTVPDEKVDEVNEYEMRSYLQNKLYLVKVASSELAEDNNVTKQKLQILRDEFASTRRTIVNNYIESSITSKIEDVDHIIVDNEEDPIAKVEDVDFEGELTKSRINNVYQNRIKQSYEHILLSIKNYLSAQTPMVQDDLSISKPHKRIVSNKLNFFNKRSKNGSRDQEEK